MDYTPLFDMYLDGLLTGEKLLEFEKELAENPEMAKEFEEYKRLNEITFMALENDTEADEMAGEDILQYRKDILNTGDDDLRKYSGRLAQASREVSFGRNITSPGIKIMSYAAAVIIVGIMITVVMIRSFRTAGPEEIYSSYYQTYEKSDAVFDLTRSMTDFFYAIQVYESGDLQRAIVLFEELTDSSRCKPYALFYAGMTYMQLGKWEEAVRSLNALLVLENVEMEITARWYLGLCYLKTRDIQNARKQFQIIASGKNEYTRKAKQILQKMRDLK